MYCSRRSMDRTSVCGTGNAGSIPAESTKIRLPIEAVWFLFELLVKILPVRSFSVGGPTHFATKNNPETSGLFLY